MSCVVFQNNITVTTEVWVFCLSISSRGRVDRSMLKWCISIFIDREKGTWGNGGKLWSSFLQSQITCLKYVEQSPILSSLDTWHCFVTRSSFDLRMQPLGHFLNLSWAEASIISLKVQLNVANVVGLFWQHNQIFWFSNKKPSQKWLDFSWRVRCLAPSRIFTMRVRHC